MDRVSDGRLRQIINALQEDMLVSPAMLIDAEAALTELRERREADNPNSPDFAQRQVEAWDKEKG